MIWRKKTEPSPVSRVVEPTLRELAERLDVLRAESLELAPEGPA